MEKLELEATKKVKFKKKRGNEEKRKKGKKEMRKSKKGVLVLFFNVLLVIY